MANFYVGHASLTRDVGTDQVSAGWVVVKGELDKSPEIVSTRLYPERAAAEKEAARLEELAKAAIP